MYSTRHNKIGCEFSAYLGMAPKPTFSAPWELWMNFSDSAIIIFVFYTSKLSGVPIFSLFANGSKTNIFSSVRALDEFLRFCVYYFRILHVKIKWCTNFQLICEWLQNQHFQLRESSGWISQFLWLLFSYFTRLN